ncbi:MAG: lipoyl synthase [Desulfoprunum sp.]|uniref:lipoyl synthase n=1 Tax=Desulfoprunum sp. TaxID=2020866 RepID=UPI00052B7701|nr:lipoyl synthase [Desulfobulbus sp. Tol-SR]
MSPCSQDRSGGGKPLWLRRRLPSGPEYEQVRQLLRTRDLHTVCQEAHCPNQFECYARGTATFMILGDRCSRSCRFCAVRHEPPGPLDPDEPERVAEAVALLDLRYAVITSVTRDDLPDGGASVFAATIGAIRRRRPTTLVEVLIPDLQGDRRALETILAAGPQVLNHNVETVPRLYPLVRPQARYARSLEVLAAVQRSRPRMICKSGLMLGLGETGVELRQVWRDLIRAGCDILTMGQYLQPSPANLPVTRFLPPEEFAMLQDEALACGFVGVAAGPFVRSSYQAEALYRRVLALF